MGLDASFVPGPGGAVVQSLVAPVVYNPAQAQVSRTSSTFADIDATNLVIAGTVPAGGKVQIVLEGVANVNSAATYCMWNLRDGSGDVAGTSRSVTNSTSRTRIRTAIVVSGLTPGAPFSFKWGHASSDNTNQVNLNRGTGTPNYGPAIMEAYALPA